MLVMDYFKASSEPQPLDISATTDIYAVLEHRKMLEDSLFELIGVVTRQVRVLDIFTCVPASGNQRDLPQTLDVQDQNLPRKCSICNNHPPHSSQDSRF